MRSERSDQIADYCDQLKDMRTSGQLQEAYQLGKQLHERFPSDEYIEGAFAWVIYDCLKRYKDEKSKYHKDLPAFLKTLRMVPNLRFDANANDLFFENIAKYLINNIGWDLRSEQNIAALQDLLATLTELDAQEVSDVYATMIAHLKEPIQVFGWDYRKANDDAGLLRLMNALATINAQAVTFIREPIGALGWDYRKANDVDGLLTLLNAIASLGDDDACFRDKETLLMFTKGFEPSKSPSDTPLAQSKKAEGTVMLAEWFGLENLTQKMFQEEEYQGKMQPSLAEKLTSQYINALGLQNQDKRFIFDKACIMTGVNALESVLQSSPAKRWIWPQYNFGKLLVQVGDAQKARLFFARALLDKWGEWYIWSAFADTFADEEPAAYAKCLFRALRLSGNADFSRALHEKALRYLKSIQKYPEAKREALMISEYRKDQDRPEPSIMESERNEDWFNVEASDDNTELYKELSTGAEAHVFPYATKEHFYVEWENDEKGLMGIASKETEETSPRSGASFHRSKHADVPNWAQGIRRTVIKDREAMQSMEVGACYTGVLSKDGRTILGDIESCTSDEFSKRFTIEFEGTFDLVEYKDKQGTEKTIGFVRDTQRGSLFVAPGLFNNSNLVTFDLVKGTARAVFKNDRWTMEVTRIDFLCKPNPEDIEKRISGEFKSTGKSFGFIDGHFVREGLDIEGCFVPERLITEENLRNHDHVVALAQKSWDKKKNRWSWTATSVLDKWSS